MTDVLKGLKAIADEQHTAFPQYRGHFDGYVLVRVTRTLHTKMGMAFLKGELAIARPEADGRYRTVYSIRNRCDTSVPVRSISIVN